MSGGLKSEGSLIIYETYCQQKRDAICRLLAREIEVKINLERGFPVAS